MAVSQNRREGISAAALGSGSPQESAGPIPCIFAGASWMGLRLLPAFRMKSGRDFKLALSSEAQAIVEGVCAHYKRAVTDLRVE